MPSPDPAHNNPGLRDEDPLAQSQIERTRGGRTHRSFPAPLGLEVPTAATAEPTHGVADETYDLGLLAQSYARWESSPGLRTVYTDIYRAMATFAAPGTALEIGSGVGTIVEILPEVVTSDIRQTPYVDCVASAYALPEVAGGPWSTIYALDVLHHLREPFRFFASATQALRPGGRIVVCDPAATPLARLFYGRFHREPVHARALQVPYEFPPDSPRGEFANMAMASALFVRDKAEVRARLEAIGLVPRYVQFRDVLAYPASGGFSGPRLLPASMLQALLWLERRAPQAWLRYMALRMIVVLEKNG